MNVHTPYPTEGTGREFAQVDGREVRLELACEHWVSRVADLSARSVITAHEANEISRMLRGGQKEVWSSPLLGNVREHTRAYIDQSRAATSG